MQRLTIVGTAGSGKTTLARQLATRLNYPCIDLDEIHWGPNWTPTEPEAFREKVRSALQSEQWIVAGNYTAVRDLVWSRADTLIWLDYSLATIMWRLLRRTIKRVVTREVLYAGNRETWKEQFFSRESLLLYVLRTYAQRRKRFSGQLAQPEYQHLAIHRFYQPHETEQWFFGLSQYIRN